MAVRVSFFEKSLNPVCDRVCDKRVQSTMSTIYEEPGGGQNLKIVLFVQFVPSSYLLYCELIFDQKVSVVCVHPP